MVDVGSGLFVKIVYLFLLSYSYNPLENTMKPKTLQQIFDKVVKHLLTQGKKAMMNAESCAYRGKDNTSCAVGCLIPDRYYNPLMEGRSVGVFESDDSGPQKELFVSAFDKSGIPHDPESLELLQELQACHDNYEVHEWKSRLKYIGEDFSLKLPKSLKD